jgi:endoglucanase
MPGQPIVVNMPKLWGFCWIVGLLTLSENAVAFSNVDKDTMTPSIPALRIINRQLQFDTGETAVLKGVSFFWSNSGWEGARFYHPAVVDYFVDTWQVNLVRAAIGIDAKGGLLDDKANLARAETLVKRAIERGIYVIVDFHSHHAEQHSEAAIRFFSHMANRYGHHPNVIYEIYNEPLPGADWSRVIKPYALKVISAIRKIDPDNLILVGTRSWSQDVDEVIKDPIKDVNLAYTLHFYAGTHKKSLMDKAQKALDAGVPLFVSEWGSVAATGDGELDFEWTCRWHSFMERYQLSRAVWAVSDKKEASAIFYPSSRSVSHIEEFNLTQAGLFARSLIRSSQSQSVAECKSWLEIDDK